MGKYELKPKIEIKDNIKILKAKEIINFIKEKTQDIENAIVIFETYPGTRLNILKERILRYLPYDEIIFSEDYALQCENFREAIMDDLSEDRTFGHLTKKEYKDFFNFDKVDNKMRSIQSNKLTIIYGTGASYFIDPDCLIYVDLNRWEIQQRYRKKEHVFFGRTLEDETIKNFKRGYFVEWRMADKIKKEYIKRADLIIDGNDNELNGITNHNFFNILKQAAHRPFRLVPYFDAGVWGGKWMQNKFDLGDNEYSRWAWGFDGVPEENSLCFKFENGIFEMPAINLVFFEPKSLLGENVEKRFGAEFPIRFDFLDTIHGGNLSLQVHPTNQYIKKVFGMDYTQEESYYILDVDEKENPACYLGLKTNVKFNEFIDELKFAQRTNEFNVDKFINCFPAKKHDHFLHPAGVIHSSARGCMVLEISSTPYIFTFKLWDWARLDLNGKPRPINIDHGKEVIDTSFTTLKCQNELVNHFETLVDNEFFKKERTGLHPKQFIETIRFTIKDKRGIIVENNDSVNMLNLVEGDQVIVESLDNSFPSLTINYAETFIVPESCKRYVIKPTNSDLKKELIILQAFVRF